MPFVPTTVSTMAAAISVATLVADDVLDVAQGHVHRIGVLPSPLVENRDAHDPGIPARRPSDRGSPVRSGRPRYPVGRSDSDQDPCDAP